MSSTSPYTRLFVLVFLCVAGILALIYFAFLRTDYAPVYQNIREADASAIVAQLDTAGIPYRLENEGHDILVPEEQVAQARVTVAGSNVAMGGTVGFELFDDSDMGLTEFAQKINFQRAMQGELSRSIMMIDGIKFARVHLAIPERTIFRAGQGTPTAAVSLETEPGAILTDQKIAGIQQLVSSSVPGLAVRDVAVLDREGDLVSSSQGALLANAAGPQSERTALESYFAVKGRTAIEQFLPKGSFDLEISLRPLAQSNIGEGAESEVLKTEEIGQTDRLRQDVSFRVLVRSPTAMAEEDRKLVQNALVEELGLAENRGDVLIFSTGALARSPEAGPLAAVTVRPTPVASAGSEGRWEDSVSSFFPSKWVWIGLVLAALVALAVWPRKRLSDDDIASFADLLKDAATDRKDL